MDVTFEARQTLAIKYTPVVTWAWNVDTGTVEAEEDFRKLLLLPAKVPLTAQLVLDRVHEGDIITLRNKLEKTVHNLDPYDFQFRVRGDNGDVRWVRGQGQVHEAHPNGTAKMVIGINYDITEQIEAAERLEAVAQEMRHRIKNSLAMVNSLATMTAREHSDIGDFIKHFRGRVEALASAQNVDVSDDLESNVDLGQAVHGALAPFTAASLWQTRFDVQISPTSICQSLAQAICLVLYELGTNSVKYGALKCETGRINITSSLQNDRLEVMWVETSSGEKDAASVDSTGFGNRLVTRLVASENGEIDIDHAGDTYTVRLVFPI